MGVRDKLDIKILNFLVGLIKNEKRKKDEREERSFLFLYLNI